MPDFRPNNDQLYPVLTMTQMVIAEQFASQPAINFSASEVLFSVGERGTPAWLVLEGQLDVSRRDGLSGEIAITSFGPGQFSGEVSQLSGNPSLASGRAGPGGCKAMPFNASHVRAMLIGAAEVGEIVMRAFILRRANLIAAGGAGCVLVDVPESARLIALAGFLRRIGYPNTVLDASAEGDGYALIQNLGYTLADLPLVICPNGEILKAPNEAELARSLGLTAEIDGEKVYDVAIVGSGPAGLAAAVYAGSEGLDVVVIEQSAAGGQAGASMRIENYLGFPAGITGQELMDRAINQSFKFGAEIVLPLAVTKMIVPPYGAGSPMRLEVAGGQQVKAKTVVVASGARYRKPDIPELSRLNGGDVSYWVSPIEAKVCSGEDVALVGGGNSAGQAVVYLAPQVRTLHLIVRRPLEETMSAYLIDRIKTLKNVFIHVGSEIVSLQTNINDRLESAGVVDRSSNTVTPLRISHLFLFIGADPNSEWLPPDIKIDDGGFIITGLFSRDADKVVLPLETSLRNVFAIGDIRSGSTKRVAAAVGEGAVVVSQIHEALKRAQ